MSRIISSISAFFAPLTISLIFLTCHPSAWAKNHPIPEGAGIALDGKALGSTVQDCYRSAQNFVSVVSACVHGRADVIGQISFENGKTSEIGSVRDLLKQLDVVGVWFTMDALHCQKNG